jgi:hypothetical protein
LQDSPKGIMINVLGKAFDKRPRYGPWEPCDYHEHANWKEREVCEIRVNMTCDLCSSDRP